MKYRDRLHAAALLAEQLGEYAGRDPLVLGVPRGAVPMAAAIAERLDADLDVVLVRKIGMPGQEEFALGAVDEEGHVFLPTPSEAYGVDRRSIDLLAKREIARLAQRRAAYTPMRRSIDPRGRLVIIVDDGAATGASMVAAIESVRRRGAAEIIAAVPVASVEAADVIGRHADRVVILATPPDFMAVALWYEDFGEVSDGDVLAILARHARPLSAG